MFFGSWGLHIWEEEEGYYVFLNNWGPGDQKIIKLGKISLVIVEKDLTARNFKKYG